MQQFPKSQTLANMLPRFCVKTLDHTISLYRKAPHELFCNSDFCCPSEVLYLGSLKKEN